MTQSCLQGVSRWFHEVFVRRVRGQRRVSRSTRLDLECLSARVVPAVVLRPFAFPNDFAIPYANADELPPDPYGLFQGGHISGPSQLVAGADGNLWFDLNGPPAIGRMTPDGTFTKFALPSTNFISTSITNLTTGRDGNVWYTVLSQNLGAPRLFLGKITPEGIATEIPLPEEFVGNYVFSETWWPRPRIQRLTHGPDGNFWFLDEVTNRLGRISLDGTVTEFGENLDFSPWWVSVFPELLVGPGNKLWFTEPSASKVGNIDLATGVVTEFAFPESHRVLQIMVALNGNLWASNSFAGDTTEFTGQGDQRSLGFGTTRGIGAQDGNVWMLGASGFTRLAPDGTRTSYATYFWGFPSNTLDAALIPLSADGLWFLYKPPGGGFIPPQIVELEFDAPAPAITTEVFPIHVTLPQDWRPYTLAAFTDFELKPGFDPLTTNLYALVDWGDGSPIGYAAVANGRGIGKYIVQESHPYQTDGDYTIQVSLTNVPPESPPIGDVLISVAVPVTVEFPPNVYFVRQVYRDLLHREAEAAGELYWTTQLDQGKPRAEVVAGIQSSVEGRQVAVNELYLQWLGRPAEAFGLDVWSGLLAKGGSLRDVQVGILLSPEFEFRWDGTLPAFPGPMPPELFAARHVAVLYRAVLHRDVEAYGLGVWTQGLLDGLSRQEVAERILASPEALGLAVQEGYQKLLDRPAEAAGADAWERFLESGHGIEEFVLGLMSSDEYFTQNSQRR